MPSALPLDQLVTRLSRIDPIAFAGVAYRSSTPKYATESDLLTGEGGKRFGGRWNPIGIAVIYASLTPETAMAETLAHQRYYRMQIEDAMPRTFIAIEVRIGAMIDFRVGAIRRRLGISLDRMLSTDWRKETRSGREPLTQMIGRAAAEIGIEGMIVPSAPDLGGYNLLIFPANLKVSSVVKVLNADRLSK